MLKDGSWLPAPVIAIIQIADSIILAARHHWCSLVMHVPLTVRLKSHLCREKLERGLDARRDSRHPFPASRVEYG